MTELVGFNLLKIIILIALPAFAGGLTSDYVKTIQGKYLKVKVGRVLASAVFASFFSFSSFYRYFVGIGNTNLLMLVCFLIGLVAFEVVQYLVTLDGWLTLVTKLKSIIIPIIETLKAFYEFNRVYRHYGSGNIEVKKLNDGGKEEHDI